MGIAKSRANLEFERDLTINDSTAVTTTSHIATVRQTTERGPVDVDGKPDVLEAGTGLTVQTKGISESNPLVVVMTIRDDIDRRVRITSNLSAVSVADDTDDQQIVLEVEPDQEPRLVVTPVWTFAEVAPSTPTTGDVWYNIRHWHLPQEWNGSEWADKYYSFPLGQASANGGTLVDIRSFAFKGKYTKKNDAGIVSGTGQTLFSHNLGVGSSVEHLDGEIWALRSAGFSWLRVSNQVVGNAANRCTLEFIIDSPNVVGLNRESTSFTAVNTSGGLNTLTWSESPTIIKVWRTF